MHDKFNGDDGGTDQCSTAPGFPLGNIKGAAHHRANEHRDQSERFRALADRMTPEIETAIFCLTEAIALDLIRLPDRSPVHPDQWQLRGKTPSNTRQW